jgi:hypothetical protein
VTGESLYSSARLLERARRIFGDDLVIDAAVAVRTDGKSEQQIQSDSLKCDRDAISINNVEIDLSASDVLLTFCNGKRVRFGVSEWGWIAAATNDLTTHNPSG